MNKFIKNIILFFVPIFLLVSGMEYVLREIPNDYSYKNEYLNNNSDLIEVLVLGSSHSFYGINPIYFSKNTFNSSHVSQSLNYDYLIFEKFKHKLINLRVIIIPISYFSLFSKIENGNEEWRVKNYSIYYNFKKHSELKYNLEVIGKNPINIFKMIKNYINGNNNITVSELGFGTNYSNVKQSNLHDTGLSASKRHTKPNLDLLKSNLDVLSKFINESREIGVKIILFTPPARDSYIENLNDHQLSVMMNSISKIIESNKNVDYFNFLRDSRFVDEDFKDADHLNGIGAKKLTKIIENLVL